MSRRRKVARGKVREEAAESKRGGGKSQWLDIPPDTEFAEMEEGYNTFGIIPYEVTIENHPKARPGDLWYHATVWVHYDVGAEKKSYACPLMTAKQRCPICEYREKLIKDERASQKEIDGLAPRRRELYNVLKDGAHEIQLWTLSYHCFHKLLMKEVAARVEIDPWVEDFPDLEGGSDLEVRFEEKKIGKNEFLDADRIDFLERKDFGEEILDEVWDLDKIVLILPYDELEALFWELDGGSPPAEDRRSRGGGGRSGRSSRGGREDRGGRSGRSSRGGREDRGGRSDRGGREEERETRGGRSGRGSRRGGGGREREEEKPPEEDKRGGDRAGRRSSREDRGGRSGRGGGRSDRRGGRQEDKEETRDRGGRSGRSSGGRGRRGAETEDKPKDDGRAGRGGRQRSGRSGRGSRREEPKDEPRDSRGGRGRGRREAEPARDEPRGGGDDECPHGFRFGVDTNEYNECDDCKVWNPCQDAFDERNAR